MVLTTSTSNDQKHPKEAYKSKYKLYSNAIDASINQLNSLHKAPAILSNSFIK